MGIPFSGPAGQGSAIVALHASGADNLVYVERPSAVSRTTLIRFKYSFYIDKSDLPGY